MRLNSGPGQRENVFLFSISCVTEWKVDINTLWHKEEKQLFDLQAELAAISTEEQFFYLKEQLDRFWHLAGIFSKKGSK